MSDQPPPPETAPSAPSPEPGSDTPPPARPWKIATAVVAVVAVASIVGTYLVMDARLSDTREELAQSQRELEEAESGGGLTDLLDGLLDGQTDGTLDDLLGEGSSDLGSIDPALVQCLAGRGSGTGLPDGDIEEQVTTVQRLIAEDRGFDTDETVDIEFVSREEVQQRAVEITADELDQDAADADAAILAAVGAIDPGADLADLQLDALEGGVGGFYDPETAQLVVGSEELDGMGTYIAAHEMVHALSDASLGLPDTVAIAEREGADAAYAALSAIEGDASLYGQMFVTEHLAMTDLLGMQTESDASSAHIDTLPHFVNRNLTFPYVEGMTFTCHQFLDGGWDAVDATYTDVPTTSAQILFPERYTADEEAMSVREPDGPAQWERIDHDTFGAADLLFLLEAPGDDPGAALSDPVDRVRAWGGGEVHAWRNGDDTAVALMLAEHGGAEPSLCETVDEFYAAAFPDAERSEEQAEVHYTGDGRSAVVRCHDGEVALGIGPDLATAESAIG